MILFDTASLVASLDPFTPPFSPINSLHLLSYRFPPIGLYFRPLQTGPPLGSEVWRQYVTHCVHDRRQRPLSAASLGAHFRLTPVPGGRDRLIQRTAAGMYRTSGNFLALAQFNCRLLLPKVPLFFYRTSYNGLTRSRRLFPGFPRSSVLFQPLTFHLSVSDIFVIRQDFGMIPNAPGILTDGGDRNKPKSRALIASSREFS